MQNNDHLKSFLDDVAEFGATTSSSHQSLHSPWSPVYSDKSPEPKPRKLRCLENEGEEEAAMLREIDAGIVRRNLGDYNLSDLSGGSSLASHILHCAARNAQNSAHAKNPVRAEFPPEELQKIRREMIIMFAMSGMRKPIDFLTSPDFLNFLQTFINSIFALSDPDTNLLCPDASVLFQPEINIFHCTAVLAREAVPVISNFIKANKTHGGCHLVIDLTSKKQRHYIGAVIHVLSAKNEMVALPVALKQFTQRPTTPDLEKFVEELKTEYAIDGFDTVVSGERADGYKIPALKRNLVCAAHSLHTVAKRAIFPDKKGDKSISIDGQLDESAKAVLKDLGKTIHLIRIFVVYVREHPRLLDSLPSLSDENDTRWMGFFTLTKNFIQLKPGDLEIISSYLETNDAQDREAYGEALTKIRNKTDALKKFVSVYQDLFDALHLLGDDQKPTIHLVSPTYFKLVKRFDQHAASEDALTSALGKAVVLLLRKKEETFLGEIQLATCLLDLNWRDVFDVIGEEMALKARDTLRKFMESECERQRRPNDRFASLCSNANSVNFELQSYFSYENQESLSGKLIMDWGDHMRSWQIMHGVARQLLSIPATCMATEDIFSYFRESDLRRPIEDTVHSASVVIRTAKEKLDHTFVCDLIDDLGLD